MILVGAQLCLLAGTLWVAMAVIARFAGPTGRNRCRLVSITTGVPLSGWITYEWGPGAGVAAILLGVGLLASLFSSALRRPAAELASRAGPE